jgi:hypothetical protein
MKERRISKRGSHRVTIRMWRYRMRCVVVVVVTVVILMLPIIK